MSTPAAPTPDHDHGDSQPVTGRTEAVGGLAKRRGREPCLTATDPPLNPDGEMKMEILESSFFSQLVYWTGFGSAPPRLEALGELFADPEFDERDVMHPLGDLGDEPMDVSGLPTFELPDMVLFPDQAVTLTVSQTDPLLRLVEQGGAAVRLADDPPATLIKFRPRSGQPREDDGVPSDVRTLGTVRAYARPGSGEATLSVLAYARVSDQGKYSRLRRNPAYEVFGACADFPELRENFVKLIRQSPGLDGVGGCNLLDQLEAIEQVGRTYEEGLAHEPEDWEDGGSEAPERPMRFLDVAADFIAVSLIQRIPNHIRGRPAASGCVQIVVVPGEFANSGSSRVQKSHPRPLRRVSDRVSNLGRPRAQNPPQSRARIGCGTGRQRARLRRAIRSRPVPHALIDDLRHEFPSPRVDGGSVRQHGLVYLKCLIGARDPQLVDQYADVVLVAVPGGVDLHRQHVLRRCAGTTRPGVLKTVRARSSLAGGMNSLAFSLSQFGSRPCSAAISSAAASTSSFAYSIRASTSRVVRSRP